MLITLIVAFLIGLVMLFIGFRLGRKDAMFFMAEVLSIVDDDGRIFNKIQAAIEEEEDELGW